MTLLEDCRFLERRARTILKYCVADDRPFSAGVVATRGEQEVAIVQFPGTIRDQILHVGLVAAGGYAADTVAIVMDTYSAMQPINPRTGAEWERGELEECARYYDGLEKGYVIDALTIHIVNRALDQAMVTMPYSIDGKRIRWRKSHTMTSLTPEHGITGFISEAMMSAMAIPPIQPTDMREVIDDENYSLERARDLFDCITTEIIGKMGGAVALTAEPGSERASNLVTFFERRHDCKVEIRHPLFTDN